LVHLFGPEDEGDLCLHAFLLGIVFIHLPLTLQMFEIVSLADDLLPHLPVGIISLPTHCRIFAKGSSTRKPTTSKQDGASSTENERSGHESLLREHPELLQQFGMDLLPVMTQVRAHFYFLLTSNYDLLELVLVLNNLCHLTGVWFKRKCANTS
jgi:hypothetical protein